MDPGCKKNGSAVLFAFMAPTIRIGGSLTVGLLYFFIACIVLKAGQFYQRIARIKNVLPHLNVTVSMSLNKI